MRQLAKDFFNVLAVGIALPIWLAYRLLAFAFGRQTVFPGFSQLVCVVPGVSGQFVRRGFYRLALPACGRDSCVGFGTIFSHPTVRIGDRVYVGSFCMLGDVTLGEDALIGSNVSIINGSRQHGIDRLDIPVREQLGVYPPVSVGQDAWIGDRAIVMANVGSHAVVGAGAVVTRPVEAYSIVAGNPARVIGSRRDECLSAPGMAHDELTEEQVFKA